MVITSTLLSSTSLSKTINSSTVLPTAYSSVKTGNIVGRVRAFFDLGSQKSVILRSVVQKYQLRVVSTVRLSICGFVSKVKSEIYDDVKFDVVIDNELTTTEAVVVEKFPDNLVMTGRTAIVKELVEVDIKLADDSVYTDIYTDIRVLIGADQYYNFVFSKKVNGVSLIPSKLGSMLSGTPPKISASVISSVFVNNVTVDAIGIKHSDEGCLEEF